MTKKITIPYFPLGLKFTTPLLFGAGIYAATNEYVFWSVMLFVIGILILTTRYVTEINLKDKKYRDYLFFLGLPLNQKARTFAVLNHIVITKGNYAQTVNTRSQSRQFDWSDYTGTLLIDDTDALDLLTKNSKAELLKGLKEFVDFLQVDVEDRTTGQHYFIDMEKV